MDGKMIDKILEKLSLTKVKSRRFLVFIVSVIMVIMGKIDSYSFVMIGAIYIGCGTFEKIAFMKGIKK